MPLDFNLLGNAPRINTPFENLDAVLRVRNQQEAAAGLREQRQAIADQRREQTEKLSRENTDREAQGQALQQGGGVRAQTLAYALTNAPNTVPALTEFFDKADEKAANIKKLRTQAQNDEADFFGDLAEGVLKNGGTPEALKVGLDYAVEQFPDYAQDTQKIAAQLQNATPEQVKGFLEHVVSQSPSRRQKPQQAPATVSPGQGVLQSDGTYKVPVPKEDTSGSKPASVQEYEYAVQHDGFKGSFKDYQNEDANRKQKAATERAPYFTYQPVFDPTGKPISAIRFDARGGPPQVVDVSALTGGGQLKPPPGDTGKQAIANEVSTVQLDRLKGLFDRGGKAFVGPASGRWEGFKQGAPGVPVNKTFSDFKAATDAFKNSVIKAVTGAAMSEPEAKRIIGQIPTELDKPDVWLSKAEQTRQNLQDLDKVLAAKAKTPQATTPPPGATPGRIRVVGPNGETGTVPDGTPLPAGWKRAG